MAKVKIGTVCSLSNAESEIHAGSGFCKRCKSFNGAYSTDKTCISCLNPQNYESSKSKRR